MHTFHHRRTVPVVLGVSGALALAQPALATENGNQHFPIGVNTASGSVMPEQGKAELYNYMMDYTADRFNDGQGNKLMPQFDLKVKAEAVRVIYTWPMERNGFTISTSVAINAADINLSADGAHGHSAQLADTQVAPVLVQWTNHKTLHITAGPYFWLPTGSYDKNRVVNAGLNYVTTDFEFGATWNPTQYLEIGIDTMTSFALGRNSATDYRSGNTFSSDFILGVKPLKRVPQLQIGLQGDIFRQFTDDTVHGVSVGTDGFRGKQNALGPQIRWNFGPGKGIVLKYQREFGVENRSQGDKFWFEFALPL